MSGWHVEVIEGNHRDGVLGFGVIVRPAPGDLWTRSGAERAAGEVRARLVDPDGMTHASDPALHLSGPDGLTVRKFDPARCKMDGQPPFPVWIGRRGDGSPAPMQQPEEDEDRVANTVGRGGIFIGYTDEGELGAWLGFPDPSSEAFATSDFGLYDLLDRIASHFAVGGGS